MLKSRENYNSKNDRVSQAKHGILECDRRNFNRIEHFKHSSGGIWKIPDKMTKFISFYKVF